MLRLTAVLLRVWRGVLYLLLLVLLGVCFLQVIMRYVFNDPFTFAEELPRVLLVWLAMLGSSYAIATRQHMRLVFFTDRLKRGRLAFMLLLDAISFCLFIAVFLYGGAVFVFDNTNQVLPVMQVNIAFAYSAIPVAGLLGALAQLGASIHLIRQGEEGFKNV